MQEAMREDAKVQVVRAIFETGRRRAAKGLTRHGPIGDFLAPGFGWQTDVFPGRARGARVLNTFLRELERGFTYKTTVTRAVAQDDHVLFEFTFRGVQSGRYRNLGEPGNRPVQVKGAGSATFNREGKILALATYWNCAWALAQLGVRVHMRPDPVPLS
jgi:hypothetical protein